MPGPRTLVHATKGMPGALHLEHMLVDNKAPNALKQAVDLLRRSRDPATWSDKPLLVLGLTPPPAAESK